MSLEKAVENISIHAPTRGATIGTILLFPPFEFQSTLPRGERRTITLADAKSGDFNPRSHEGSDLSD